MSKKVLGIILSVLIGLMLVPSLQVKADDDYHAHDDSWTATTTLPTQAGKYYLTDNVVLDSNTTWTVPSGEVFLCLNGYGIIGSNSNQYPVIEVPSGATLNLFDCGDTENKFSVDSNGKATVGSGSETFTGGYITGGFGGDNGGGVYINGGRFDMYGGTIIGNTADNGGAGVRVDKGVFTLIDGRICYNSTNLAGGVRIFSAAATMDMIGGQIDHNTATGTSTGDSNAGHGGGILIDGTTKDNLGYGFLNLTGGKIIDNIAKNDGGAIYVDGTSTFALGGNPTISGNKVGNANNNVFLSSGRVITFIEKVDSGVTIPVTTAVKPSATTVVITDTLIGSASKKNFISDDQDYFVEDKDDKAVLCYGYPLWVGGIQVNAVNKDDVLGDGTVKFDRETNTLTLTNATINGVYEIPDQQDTENPVAESYNIYTEGIDLTIQLVGTNTLGDGESDFGVNNLTGNINFEGDGSLTTDTKWTGIAAMGSITITDATIESTGEIVGIAAMDGNMTITNAAVTATGKTGRGVSVLNGSVIIKGDSTVIGITLNEKAVGPWRLPTAGIAADNGIEIGDGLGNTTPKFGTVEKTEVEIGDGLSPRVFYTIMDGDKIAKSTVIEPASALSFDLGGGTLYGKTGTITEYCKDGETIKLPEAPTKEGYKFLYWKGSQYDAGAEYKVDGPHEFTAEWEKENPKTGDSTNVGLWAALLGGSLLAMILAFAGRKLLKKSR